MRDKATLAKTESFHENVFGWVYLSYILSLQVYNLQRFESDLHHRYPLFTDTTVIQPLEFLYFILSKALGFKNQKHWKDSRKPFNDNHIKSIPAKAKGAKLKGKKGCKKAQNDYVNGLLPNSTANQASLLWYPNSSHISSQYYTSIPPEKW